ncbi:hypothetical protein ACJX0J_009656, partial [Zea mays]
MIPYPLYRALQGGKLQHTDIDKFIMWLVGNVCSLYVHKDATGWAMWTYVHHLMQKKKKQQRQTSKHTDAASQKLENRPTQRNGKMNIRNNSVALKLLGFDSLVAFGATEDLEDEFSIFELHSADREMNMFNAANLRASLY